jgi:hypothetical protein
MLGSGLLDGWGGGLLTSVEGFKLLVEGYEQ